MKPHSKTKEITDFVLDNKEAIINRLITKKDIAEMFSVNQTLVSRICIDKGLRTRFIPGKGKSEQEKNIILDKIIDYVVNNGGTVTAAIEKLGYRMLPNRVIARASQQGIDLSHYRHSGRRFGDWLVMPGESQRCYVADTKVDAKCLCCGTIHSVLLVNLRAGHSSRCLPCALKTKVQYKVVSRDGKEEFGSMREFILFASGMTKYQIKKDFREDGFVVYEGKTYDCIRKVSKRLR